LGEIADPDYRTYKNTNFVEDDVHCDHILVQVVV